MEISNHADELITVSTLHHSIRKSNIWTIVRLVTSLVIGFFVTTLIVRKLSVEEFGVYSVLFSLIGLVGAIASFGIQDVFRRFLPESLQNHNFGLIKHIVNYGLIIRLLLSVAVVVFIMLFSSDVGRILKVENFSSYFAVFGIAIIAYLESGLLTTALNSIFLHKYSAIANLVYVFFRAGLAFFVLDAGYGVSGLLWVEAISWTFWAVVQWFFYYGFFAAKHSSVINEKIPVKRFAKYGGMSSLNDIGSNVLGVSTDFLIITAYLGPAAVALYAFSDRVIKMITNMLPHVVLADVIRPSFFSRYAQSGDVKDIEKMFNLVLKISAITIVPIVFVIFALSETFISIVFKSEYIDAGSILSLLAVFSAINIFAYPTGLVLQTFEKVNIILYSKIFAVANILISIAVVKQYGVIGVVLSTCFCTFFKNYYCYYYMKKVCEINVSWMSIFKIVINSLLLFISLLLLKDFISDIFSLAAAVLITGIIYYFATRFNSPFSSDERKFINRVTPIPFPVL